MSPVARRNAAAYLARVAYPNGQAIASQRTGAGPDGGQAAGAGGAAPVGTTAPIGGGQARGDLARVVARASAAGHHASAVAALRRAWESWPASVRSLVAYPLRPGSGGTVRLGARPAVQTSPTTCGSAVLVLLAAAGDPVVAAWLATGEVLGALPPDLAGVTTVAGDDPGARFGRAQRAMLRATARRALGPFPWPVAFGTPPWTAARHARFPGVRYVQRPVDDGDRAAMDRILAAIRAATARGVPVPLFTGGDPAHGLETAVPRHVVLAVPGGGSSGLPGAWAGDAGDLSIYEPTTGRVHRVPPTALVARREAHPALGHWPHVVWALLPVPRPDARAWGRADTVSP